MLLLLAAPLFCWQKILGCFAPLVHDTLFDAQLGEHLAHSASLALSEFGSFNELAGCLPLLSKLVAFFRCAEIPESVQHFNFIFHRFRKAVVAFVQSLTFLGCEPEAVGICLALRNCVVYSKSEGKHAQRGNQSLQK